MIRSKRIPFTIIPDFENLPPGFKSVRFAAPLGEFRPGPGIVTVECLTMRQYLNVQRMLQFYAEGSSPLLSGAGISSEDILFQTGVGHELRHVHDCLLSFSYLEATRRKMLLGLNLRVFLDAFKCAEGGGLLPIPLMDWVMTAEPVRAETLRSLREFYADENLKICDLPYFPLKRLEDLAGDPDQLRDAVLVCVRGAFSIELLLNREPLRGFPSPAEIFELSATAVQFLTIIDRFGFRVAEDIFRTNFTGTSYDRALDLMTGILHGDGDQRIFGPDALVLTSAMCLSAICAGPPEAATHPSACPSLRFAKLYVLARKNRPEVRSRLNDVESLIQYFDELLGEPPLAERLEASTLYFEKVTSDMKQSEALETDPAYGAVIRYWEELLSMRKQLQEAVLDQLYFHLRGGFESQLAKNLVIPPIVINCTRLDPASYADDPRGADFAERIQGKEVMFCVSDRMNALKREIHFVEKADVIAMKIFFDVDVTQSVERRQGLKTGIRELVGRGVISLQELKGSAIASLTAL
ncbi:hypothetical protein [Rhizobium sp. BK068]|uniref:hypothetical protein n=1 Tax=Rhizobium sp. BK068 TaxID=2512130 RepID=UPI0010503F01|nr:hypothetical protein [Rhizobium sp. BK068]TCM76588.1 hypothetical protein EV291_1095 [Rhizobium sp. BK068]